MRNKKRIAALLALVMILGVLAGCRAVLSPKRRPARGPASVPPPERHPPRK